MKMLGDYVVWVEEVWYNSVHNVRQGRKIKNEKTK